MKSNSNDNDSECQFFGEDEVYRYQDKTGQVQFGIVLENSEYASSDEDSEEDEQSQKLKKGQVRVTWYPTGKENVVSEKKVTIQCSNLGPYRCEVIFFMFACRFVLPIGL